jgi:phosphatidylserine synthase
MFNEDEPYFDTFDNMADACSRGVRPALVTARGNPLGNAAVSLFR